MKVFNYIFVFEIMIDGVLVGILNWCVFVMVGDDEVVVFVMWFYDEVGFDIVNIGLLSEFWWVECDCLVYVVC